MFSKVYLRVTISCLLLSFSPITSAAMDGIVKTNNYISEVPPVRLAYVKLKENNMLSNDYKAAMTVQVISVRNIVDSGHIAGKVEQKPIPKLLLGFACGLAFLGVMRKRLSR